MDVLQILKSKKYLQVEKQVFTYKSRMLIT